MKAEKLGKLLQALVVPIRTYQWAVDKWSKFTFPPGDVVDFPRSVWCAKVPPGLGERDIIGFEESSDGLVYTPVDVRPAISLFDFLWSSDPTFIIIRNSGGVLLYVRGLEIVEKIVIASGGVVGFPTTPMLDTPVWWYDDELWILADRIPTGARIPVPDGTEVRIRYFESSKHTLQYRVRIGNNYIGLLKDDWNTPLDDLGESLTVVRRNDEPNQSFQTRIRNLLQFNSLEGLNGVAFRIASILGLVEEQTFASSGEYTLSGIYHVFVDGIPSVEIRREELESDSEGKVFTAKSIFWENYVILLNGRILSPDEFQYDGVNTVVFPKKISDPVVAVSWRVLWKFDNNKLYIAPSILYPSVNVKTTGSLRVWSCDIRNGYSLGLVDAVGRPTQLLYDIADVVYMNSPICVGSAVWGVRWPQFQSEAPKTELMPLLWDS
jgi:hypothetical protein